MHRCPLFSERKREEGERANERPNAVISIHSTHTPSVLVTVIIAVTSAAVVQPQPSQRNCHGHNPPNPKSVIDFPLPLLKVPTHRKEDNEALSRLNKQL
ncbi:hypothetical protein KIN20_006609 [Parelaphostrongylus tenuis]|uniref:Uncharacterized protein n=1 Tax=Parelaphostrongylus tenuis TaxID=148309 RepID=A0AAD5M557_PARTN|nr:hypothetical protein KIN20_006609 [Parelaphostrongylus tenuis]